MSQLKTYIQALVTEKIPDAFTLRKEELARKIPTGIQPLDLLIQGFQRGELTEIYGQGSSGRTTLAISFMAEVTRRAEACALVDVSDSLDPESLSVADANLDQLLWIRCGKASEASPDSSLIDQCNPRLTQGQPLPGSSAMPRSNFSSCGHPRQEVRGLSHAIATLMKGGPNSSIMRPVDTLSPMGEGVKRPLVVPPCVRGDWRGGMDSIVPTGQGEEENCERIQLPSLARRGRGGGRESSWTDPPESPLTKGDTCNLTAKPIFSQLRGEGVYTSVDRLVDKSLQDQGKEAPERHAIWKRLEQALRVTDLLLNNGGFGAIVLDLGDVPIENARRIPLTSWFRFRRSVENTPTALVLLNKEPCCGTCASLVLHCQNRHVRWLSVSGSALNSHMSTLEGLDFAVGKTRCRGQAYVEVTNGKHSPLASSVHWQTRMSWARGQP